MLKLNGFLKVCEYALIRVMRVWRVVKLNPFVGIVPKNIPPKLFLYILPILPADNYRELKLARFWYADAHSGCRPRLKNARACLSSLMLPRALRGGFRGGGKMRIGPLGLFTGKHSRHRIGCFLSLLVFENSSLRWIPLLMRGITSSCPS